MTINLDLFDMCYIALKIEVYKIVKFSLVLVAIRFKNHQGIINFLANLLIH